MCDEIIFQDNVTSEAFHIIYEWMISNGQESNRIFRKDNILDLFCAAQFLAIKGKNITLYLLYI